MKRSKLYKIVKESVKEALQEQRNVRNRRKDNRLNNGERKKQEEIANESFIERSIRNSVKNTKSLNFWLKTLKLDDKFKPQDFIGSNGNELVQIFQDQQKEITGGGGSGAGLGSNPLDIWDVNSNSSCNAIQFTDGWGSCNSSGMTTGFSLGGTVFAPGTIPCAGGSILPGLNPTQTLPNFIAYVNTLGFPISSLSTILPGSSIEGLSDTCPQCQPNNITTAGPVLPAPNGGNNVGLTAPTGLSLIDDFSCTFGDFCTRQFMDNDFCRPVADGGNGDICSGQSANTSIFAAITVDNGLCTWDGCIDVPVDTNYICSLHNGALCDVQGPTGTEQPPGTFTNSGCTAVNGCTNGDFLPTIGGNYDSNNNVDDSSCTIANYCDDNTAPNWICNLSNGVFCDGTGNLNTTYIDNVGVTQTLNFGAPDNTTCSVNGCADDGTDPSYPGRPAGAPLNFIPSNYTPGAVEDGSCIYDTDGDGTWDWDELDGCTDSAALNFDPLATEDDGSCIVSIPGCIDNGDILNNTNIQAWFDFTNYNDQDFWIGAITDLGTTDYATNTNIPQYPGISSPAFNSLANVDDGSCTYPQGCTDPNANNYDPNAIIDDGSCQTLGCTEPTANNFNSAADTDDNSCTFDGCTETAAGAYGLFDTDGVGTQTILDLPGSPYDGRVLSTTLGDTTVADACNFEGCLDSSFDNYICDIAANAGFAYLCTGYSGIGTGTPDTGTYGPNAFIDPNNICTNNAYGGCQDSTPGIPGTVHDNTDVNGNGSYLAMNYDPNAALPGDCDYTYCGDSDAYNYSPGPWTDNSVVDNSLCEYEGCADSSYQSGNVSQEVTPGSGIYFYNIDNDGCQINPGSNNPPNGLFLSGELSPGNTSCCANFGCIDDGNVTNPNFWTTNNLITNTNYASVTGISTYPGPYIGGATAGNYNSNASLDDGSCTYIMGCTDPSSPNYDPNAIIDNGDCERECKRVKLQQCTPADVSYEYNIDCAHVAGATPQLNDEVWTSNGRAQNNVSNAGVQLPCPPGPALGVHDITYPPIGSPGNFDGEIQSLSNGCEYQWSSGGSNWQSYPIGAFNTYSDEVIGVDRKPDKIRAVFRIIEVSPATTSNLTNLPSWTCGTNPPGSNIGIGVGIGVSGGVADADNETIKEVKTSQYLRKALKDFYTKK